MSRMLLQMPLRLAPLRRRIRFELEQEYFAEAQRSVPIGYGCSAPILHPDYWHSFTEIFFQGEYDGAGQRFPLPRRWLDLGCHAGFFSLYTAWQRLRTGDRTPVEALLIDGDSRIAPQIQRLVDENRLGDSFQFAYGAISTQPSPLSFVERECMASGTAGFADKSSNGGVREVPVLSPDEILRLLPPPYDLIKVDIEGGEYDFLAGYEVVLQHTSTMLFEWHSWHRGGGGLPQLQKLASDLGFTRQEEFKTPHQVLLRGTHVECGVLLLKRPSS